MRQLKKICKISWIFTKNSKRLKQNNNVEATLVWKHVLCGPALELLIRSFFKPKLIISKRFWLIWSLCASSKIDFFLLKNRCMNFEAPRSRKLSLSKQKLNQMVSGLLNWEVRSIEPNEIQKLAIYIFCDIKNFNCGFACYGFTRPVLSAWFILNEDNSICSFALRRMDSEDFRSCTLHFEIPKKQVIEREATIWGKTVLKTFRY